MSDPLTSCEVFLEQADPLNGLSDNVKTLLIKELEYVVLRAKYLHTPGFNNSVKKMYVFINELVMPDKDMRNSITVDLKNEYDQVISHVRMNGWGIVSYD